MRNNPTVEEFIARLGLKPHPEGGFFVESFRSPLEQTLPDGRVRAASTAIYFLLPCGAFSAWHRVSSDEVWHFYDGDPLGLITLNREGILENATLGREIASGQRPQFVVPAGVLQAAKPLNGEYGYSLVGCTVAPGFDFNDFEMPDRAALLNLFPGHSAVISALTRD
ncbi:MAG: cupin domain-containing protein [bacterium]